MLRLGDGCPRDALSTFGGDLELWHQIEYCISDMNCWSVHLLQYFRAKWLHAQARLGATLRVEEGWAAILRALSIAPGSRVVFRNQQRLPPVLTCFPVSLCDLSCSVSMVKYVAEESQ